MLHKQTKIVSIYQLNIKLIQVDKSFGKWYNLIPYILYHKRGILLAKAYVYKVDFKISLFGFIHVVKIR